MRRMFKIYAGLIIAGLFIWWLNMPFMDSYSKSSIKVVTETPILADIVSELVGPEIEVNSIVLRNTYKDKTIVSKQSVRLIKEADIIILNGLDKELMNQVTALNKKGAQISSVDKIVKRGLRGKGIDDFYWMNLTRFGRMISLIQIYLKNEIPELRSEINYRHNEYMQRIQQLIQRNNQEINNIDQGERVIAGDHDSIRQLALANDITYINLKLSDANNVDEISEKLDLLRKNKISTIFQVYGGDSSRIDQLIKFALEEGRVINKSEPIYSLNLGDKGTNIDSFLKIMSINSRTVIDEIKE